MSRCPVVITELIGGPLDGIRIRLDKDECTADLDCIAVVLAELGPPYDSVKPPLAVYEVVVWRGHLALLFSEYVEHVGDEE